MALKLNVYKTVTAIATTVPTEIYAAPVGYSGIVLLAQATNISSTSLDITLYHKRPSISGDIITEIANSFPISGNDTLSLINGKLVLESGDALILASNNDTNIKLILSILETLN